MKILIADDIKEIAHLIGEFVLKKGHEADVVFEGEAAKKRLLGNEYDVAFIDHNMPGITGLELIKLAREKGLKTKTVIISGYGAMKDSLAKRTGADGYIHKPCNLDEVDALLREFSPCHETPVSGQARKTVFIVDSDRDITELVRAKLTACGYQVAAASSFEAYLARTVSRRPDLLLIDSVILEKRELTMPPGGTHGKKDDFSVIVLTARLDEEIQRRIEKEPAIKGYLIKPFTADELLGAVEEGLGAL